MAHCYNSECPMLTVEKENCACAGLCPRFTDAPVQVTTSNRTDAAAQSNYATTTIKTEETK